MIKSASLQNVQPASVQPTIHVPVGFHTLGTINVGQLRELMADLPDSAPVGVDLAAIGLEHGNQTVESAWGAYTIDNGLIIVRQ